MEIKIYYPVHYRDYADGKYKAWLGEARKATTKPNDTRKYGEKVDVGTDWFDTKEEAIAEINSQCSKIIEHKEYEYYGESRY